MAIVRLQEAADCLEKARELADQMGNPPLMWKARYSLSQVYKKQGKPEAAELELEQAIAVIERMASKVTDTEVRQTFLKSQQVQAVYEGAKGSLGREVAMFQSFLQNRRDRAGKGKLSAALGIVSQKKTSVHNLW